MPSRPEPVQPVLPAGPEAAARVTAVQRLRSLAMSRALSAEAPLAETLRGLAVLELQVMAARQAVTDAARAEGAEDTAIAAAMGISVPELRRRHP